MTITQTARPFVLCEAEVVLAQRLSPSFVRVHLAAPELAESEQVGDLDVGECHVGSSKRGRNDQDCDGELFNDKN